MSDQVSGRVSIQTLEKSGEQSRGEDQHEGSEGDRGVGRAHAAVGVRQWLCNTRREHEIKENSSTST